MKCTNYKSYSHIFLRSLRAPIIGLGFIFFLGGCDRAKNKESGHLSSEKSAVIKDLNWCAENGDIDGIKTFLTTSNINGLGDQRPPLHLAAKGGHIAMVEYLLGQDANVNKKDASLGWTPIHYASNAGHVDIVALLIANGATMNISDARGNYPIHTAASQGYIDVIKVLLKAGAKPDQESGNPYGDKQRMSISSEISGFSASDNYQPIHSAAAGNQPGAVKFFIQLGISPEAKDGAGRSVLSYATRKRGWCNIWADTIRLVDRDGAFERASKEVISTDGYYITNESPPRYIRFMPEETEIYPGSNEVGPSNRAVICIGARGGTSPSEIAKWLSPSNEDAKKQGNFITGRYKLMGSNVTLETFEGSNISFLRSDNQLIISIRTLQQEAFPESYGSGSDIMCKFVSWN